MKVSENIFNVDLKKASMTAATAVPLRDGYLGCRDAGSHGSAAAVFSFSK